MESAQQDHWSERGRATSVANADALSRPRRSVLALGLMKYILLLALLLGTTSMVGAAEWDN